MSSDEHKDRRELVRAWLKENVLWPRTPSEISISEVEFDWDRLTGSFALSLDGQRLEERFDISIEITGRVKCNPPMFHSPLGAPASYAAVHLDQKTEAAVLRALGLLFPRLRAFGLHKDIGLIVDGLTPMDRRIIDRTDFEEKRKRIESGDTVITIPVDSS